MDLQKKTKLITIFISLFFAIIFFSSPTKASAATVWYVDCSGGSNSNTGQTDFSHAFKTLAQANSSAATGDTVRVLSGLCTEASSLSLTKGIEWIADNGSGGAGSVTIKLASGSPVAFISAAAGTTQSFNGFTFDGQGLDYTLKFPAGTGTVNFVNCTIKDAVTDVLYTYSGGNLNFTGCTITSSFDAVNLVDSTNDNLSFVNSTFINNNSSSSGGRIFNSSAASTTSATFDGCTLNNTDSNSSANRETIRMTGGASLIINNSSIHKETGTGKLISASAAVGITITNNSNIYYSAAATAGSSAMSIPILGTGTANITDNTFNVSGVSVMIDSRNISANNLIFSDNVVTFSNTLTLSAILNRSNTSYNASGSSGSNTISGNEITISGSGSGYVFSLTRGTRVSAGATIFDDNTIVLGTGTNFGVISITETDTGTESTPVSIQDNSITQNSVSGSSNLFNLLDVSYVNFKNNTVTTHATSQSIFVLSPQDVASWTGLGRAEVSNNNLTFDSTAGKAIAIGQDGTSGPSYDQKYNGSIIENNIISGPAASGSGTYSGNYHTILIGHQKGVHVRFNKINGGAIGLVIKNQAIDNNYTGGVYGNIFMNNYWAGILVKGAVNENIHNNTFYNTGVSYSSAGAYHPAISMSYDGDSNYANGSGTSIRNNIFYWQSGLYAVAADQYSYHDVVLQNNIYYNELGSAGSSSQLFFWNTETITGFSNWLLSSANEEDSSFSDPKFVSAANFGLQPFSPAIDSGTTAAVTATSTDYLGLPVYGVVDIGAYEYQPTSSLALNNPQYSGNFRVYGDGKYRYLNATSTSAVAKFFVSPLSGGYYDYTASTTRPSYLDVSDISWDSVKSWTSSSSIATTTIYTIGDLTPSYYYLVTLDGSATSTISGSACTFGSCQTNSSGSLTFEYAGGYSAHTFSISPDVDGPTGLILSSPSDNSSLSSLAVFSWGVATDSGSGIAKYQLYVNSSLYRDNIDSAASSLSVSSQLSCGHYTWQIKAIDNNGNIASSEIWDFDISCGSGLPLVAILPLQKPLVTVDNPTGEFKATLVSFDSKTNKAVLKFIVGSDTTKVAISENSQFINCSQLEFKNPISFVLQSKDTKDLYIKFYNQYGQSSDLIVVGLPKTTETLSPVVTVGNDDNSSMADIWPEDFVFKKYLQYGSVDPSVKNLQIILNRLGFLVAKSGYGSAGQETNFFGAATKAALIRFQARYGIKPNNGRMGPLTTAKINSLLK